MLDKDLILKSLYAESYYIDKNSLNKFITSWKIDPVYEEDGVDFFDDLSVMRIKKGINLKAQGYSDAQIISKLGKLELPAETTVVVEEVKELPQTPELKNITLDVTNQTLQVLAEAIAKKISDDIKDTDMASKLIEAGGYKRDSENLSKQVKELLEDNRKLSERINKLENETFTAKLRKLFFGK